MNCRRFFLNEILAVRPISVTHWTNAVTGPLFSIPTYDKEKRAYYGLMCPHDIVRTCNMTPVFKYNTADVDDSVWLETVTTV